MKISVDVKGMEAVKEMLAGHAKQVRFAAAKALNNTAFAVNKSIKDEMQAKFKGGATPYSLRAFSVKKATRDVLEATVYLRTEGPGKGTDYDKALAHLFIGGTRAWKRMEGAFRRINALPGGYMMVPGKACPLDSYGNPPRGLILQLLSYFKTFGEQGFRANMTDKRKAKLAGRGVTASGYKTINGVEYFISYGKRGRPGGDRYVHGRFDQHLPPGIWARSGIHGSTVKPIFMFVRVGMWRKMIDLGQVGRETVDRVWQSEFDKEFAFAMRTAR